MSGFVGGADIATRATPDSPVEPAGDAWTERLARLRRLEADLASLPAGALDADDERERDRIHSWVLAQQRFFGDVQQALQSRGARTSAEGERLLLPEERQVLNETERFANQTQAALAQGRARAGL